MDRRIDDPLVRRVASMLRKHCLAGPGDHVLVGLSGGPDSVALLCALLEIAATSEDALRVSAAHLNHGLRPGGADTDAQFCRELCDRLGVALVTDSRDVGAARAASGESLETAARQVRYRFLAETARRLDATAVAVGHTLDDQAETVLMRVLRGTGLRGLRGMPIRRPLTRGSGIRLVRPMLTTSRDDLLEFLERRGTPYRIDETNADPGPMRNRVRNLLLPAVREILGRDPRGALARLASTANETARLLQRLGKESHDEVVATVAPGEITIREAALRSLDPAIRYEVLRRVFWRLAGTTPEEREARAFARALEESAGLPTTLRGGLRVERAADDLLRIRVLHEDAALDDAPLVVDVILPVPGDVTVPELGYRLHAERIDNAEASLDHDPSFHTEAFALDGLTLPLCIRTWRDGDRIAIDGDGRQKKLQDVFVDAKVPRLDRRRTPVVTDAKGRILWVVGVRRDGATFVTPQSRGALVIRAESIAVVSAPPA